MCINGSLVDVSGTASASTFEVPDRILKASVRLDGMGVMDEDEVEVLGPHGKVTAEQLRVEACRALLVFSGERYTAWRPRGWRCSPRALLQRWLLWQYRLGPRK